MIEITGVKVRCDGENCNSLPETIEFVEPLFVGYIEDLHVVLVKVKEEYSAKSFYSYLQEYLKSWAIWPYETLCPECRKKQ